MTISHLVSTWWVLMGWGLLFVLLHHVQRESNTAAQLGDRWASVIKNVSVHSLHLVAISC